MHCHYTVFLLLLFFSFFFHRRFFFALHWRHRSPNESCTFVGLATRLKETVESDANCNCNQTKQNNISSYFLWQKSIRLTTLISQYFDHFASCLLFLPLRFFFIDFYMFLFHAGRHTISRFDVEMVPFIVRCCCCCCRCWWMQSTKRLKTINISYSNVKCAEGKVRICCCKKLKYERIQICRSDWHCDSNVHTHDFHRHTNTRRDRVVRFANGLHCNFSARCIHFGLFFLSTSFSLN